MSPSAVNSKSSLKLERKVIFEYFAPSADKVQIAGDFNNWEPSLTPLRKERDGRWKAVMVLPAGRFQYRFLVDGSWQNDQKPAECVPNPYGSWNCVLEIA